jgi:HPt (histidine-containing phosphotransfer) domain-containing protein
MTGGTEAGYRKVLAQFYKDAVERLPVFAEAPGETALAAFSAQAHAIKSAAGTIGAEEVSKEAAVLEAAGKAGDLDTIRTTLPGFHGHLAGLSAELHKVLEEGWEEKGAEAQDGNREALLAPLSALKAALEAKNMKEIDKLLGETEGLPLDAKTQDAVNALSDTVLMGEYTRAIDTIDKILERKLS